MTYGLLTQRSVTIEEARIRGVRLDEPLLLRLGGGARARIVAAGVGVAGADGQEKRDSDLLLPAVPAGLPGRGAPAPAPAGGAAGAAGAVGAGVGAARARAVGDGGGRGRGGRPDDRVGRPGRGAGSGRRRGAGAAGAVRGARPALTLLCTPIRTGRVGPVRMGVQSKGAQA
ncbi:hypothetical protein I4I82_20320 [Pseudonocardia oceani]|uniref:Uncharacterized protein n=1 Tax=Pseudonocardia oceani TaxID=2792013 RepID=A0ABS6UCN8_9PSEU|nr:hypothetical protein [Pseudonocardia oceani]